MMRRSIIINKKVSLFVTSIVVVLFLLSPISMAGYSSSYNLNRIVDDIGESSLEGDTGIDSNNVDPVEPEIVEEPAADVSEDINEPDQIDDEPDQINDETGNTPESDISDGPIEPIVISSGGNSPDSSNAVTVYPIGGTEPEPSPIPTYGDFRFPEDLQAGDLIICDAGYSYDKGVFRFVPDNLSGHCHIVFDVPGKDSQDSTIYANAVGTYSEGVHTVPIYRNPLVSGGMWEGNVYFAVGRVKNATKEQKQAAAEWAFEQIGPAEYQQYWLPWIGPIKSAEPNGNNQPADSQFYCSEIVWAAYYNVTKGEIDIDKDGWAPLSASWYPKFMRVPAVRPLEIYEDDDVEIVYEHWHSEEPDTIASTDHSNDSYSNSIDNIASSSESTGYTINTTNYQNSNANALLTLILNNILKRRC